MKSRRPFFLLRWFHATREFIRESVAELKRVVWPTWDEVRNYTYLVVLVMVIVGAWMAIIYMVLDFIANSPLVRLYG